MQTKTINRTLCLTALVLSLGACNGNESTEERIARADQYLADSKYKSAIIELKNALQQDSESAKARFLLGKAYLKTGDMPSAQKEFERARKFGWPAADMQPVLARTLLAQGEYAQVRELSEQGLGPNAGAELLALQAQAALAQGDTWDAEELINRALESAPDSITALLARARLLANQDNVEGAIVVLQQVLTIDPRQAEAWSLRGDFLTHQLDLPNAIAAYDKAVELRELNSGDRFKRALLNLQLGNYEAAQADATALLKLAPQNPGAAYIQGLLHYQAGDYEQAIAFLSLAEPASDSFPLTLFFLASAHLQEGNSESALALAERFHKMVPDSTRGRKLLALLRLQEGNNAAVQALLQPVLQSDPDDIDALNLTANALLREGSINEGIALLTRVAALQPDSPVAQVRLGAGLLMGGESDNAAKHMETALELNPEFQQAEILLVLNHLNKRDFNAAISAAQAYQNRHPTSVTPLNLLGKVYQQAGQPEEARAAYQRALALDAGDPAANHNLAQIALAENDLAAARKFYETLLAAHQDSVPALVQLALLDARENDESALVAHLQQAMKTDPNALQPRVMLARFYLGKGKPEQVAPLFTSLDAKQRQTPEVLRLLATAQLSTRDASAAQFTLEQLLESTPDSAQVRYMMAMAASGTGDEKRAEEELQRALALDENFVPARLVLARLALAKSDTAAFAKQLEQLTVLAPDNPDVLLLQASDQRSRGDHDSAVEFASRAFQLQPSSATLIALAGFQQAAGDEAGAWQRYTAWLQERPDDLAVRMSYANSLQVAGRPEDAGSQYSHVLQSEPDNVIALNNQAWTLREQNPSQALVYARKAVELAPESPDVLDTLAVVEYINKDYVTAQRNIRRALKSAPDHPSMLYHSAMIDTALNNESTARATLEKLLAVNPDFPELAEARALLIQLSH